MPVGYCLSSVPLFVPILSMKGNTLATLISTTSRTLLFLFTRLVAAGVMFGYMMGVDERKKKVREYHFGLC